MSDEQQKPNLKDIQPKEIERQLTTIDGFIKQFGNIEGGKLYKLENFPSDEEAQRLSKLKTEITVMELADNEVVITKGLGKTQSALMREGLLKLKPVRKAHTHPVQPVNSKGLRRLAEKIGINFDDIDQDTVAMMGIIMPSPEDFVLGSVGATTNEIWNEYGKTIYETYQASQDELLGLGLQMTGGLYSERSFMTTLVDSSFTIQEKVKKMNSLLSSLGLSFEFHPWEVEREENIKTH